MIGAHRDSHMLDSWVVRNLGILFMAHVAYDTCNVEPSFVL
jgi:hypothetical protein